MRSCCRCNAAKLIDVELGRVLFRIRPWGLIRFDMDASPWCPGPSRPEVHKIQPSGEGPKQKDNKANEGPELQAVLLVSFC
jgi:hypothetical protein